MGDEFEWGPAKERRNRLKHGFGFEEAATVFEDHRARTRNDDTHSEGEDRYIIIGLSAAGRVLVIAHTHRGDRIRIISARKATPRERAVYEEDRRD